MITEVPSRLKDSLLKRSPTKKLYNLVLAGTLLWTVLDQTSCIEPPSIPYGNEWLDQPLLAKPGHVYLVTFIESVDLLPSQVGYTGRDSLLKTPLHDLAAQAIIIKADDLRGQGTRKWGQFFDLVEHYQIAYSAGLICQSMETLFTVGRAYLLKRIQSGCELWLHGWDHFLSDSLAEFQGAGYQHQYNHLRQSVDIVKERLSYTMHTFGAPGGRTDDNTMLALKAVPEINVWLDGKETPGLLNLPVAWIAEDPTGTVRPLEEFLSRFDMYHQWDVIMLQVHPNTWDDEGFSHFAAALDTLTHLNDFAFMTPYQYYKRVMDRDAISVYKLDAVIYRFDFTMAQFDHFLEFDVLYTVSADPLP